MESSVGRFGGRVQRMPMTFGPSVDRNAMAFILVASLMKTYLAQAGHYLLM